jgi:hypothetical protein
MGEWRYRSTILEHYMEASGQLHAPAHLTLGKKVSGTQWTVGWVGPRAGLDAMSKRNLTPARNRTPSIHTVACRYTNWAIPDLCWAFYTLRFTGQNTVLMKPRCTATNHTLVLLQSLSPPASGRNVGGQAALPRQQCKQSSPSSQYICSDEHAWVSFW